MSAPVIAYYRGGDGYALDRAVIAIAHRLEQETGAAPDRWRVSGAETSVAQIAERVGTAPMFGGGCVAVVTDPGPLLRSKDARESLGRALGAVAPGNALVFIEQGDAGNKRAAMYATLEASVLKAGGSARAFAAPKAGQLAGWLRNLATEREITLERDAADELARRVGGFVGEGDVDRQRQGSLAAAELEKLALYRQAAPITIADVRALVPEVIPDSTWAMLDAVADRRADVAGPLLDRLLDTTPLPGDRRPAPPADPGPADRRGPRRGRQPPTGDREGDRRAGFAPDARAEERAPSRTGAPPVPTAAYLPTPAADPAGE